MKPTELTFHQKLHQLLVTAQMLEISFEILDNGVCFKYDGDEDYFAEWRVLKEPWQLNDTYEPWFFSVAREKIAQQKTLNTALTRLRETFTSEERTLLGEHVILGGTL